MSQAPYGPDGKPAYSGVVPFITIRGRRGKEAVATYEKALGAKLVDQAPAEDGERLMQACLEVNGGWFMLSDDFPEYMGREAGTPEGATHHLMVADVDAAVKQAGEGGFTVTLEPHDAFWGDRYAQAKDPFGHTWAWVGPLKGDAT